MNAISAISAPATTIPAYTRHGTQGNHVAASTGHTQIDCVEIKAGVGFGGDWERPQLWVILKGHGRLVHGEEGVAIPAATGHIEHFAANERRLLVAESDATLLIIEGDQWDFEGPWSEWQDPTCRIVSHQRYYSG
jgi:hypothetical protein